MGRWSFIIRIFWGGVSLFLCFTLLGKDKTIWLSPPLDSSAHFGGSASEGSVLVFKGTEEPAPRNLVKGPLETALEKWKQVYLSSSMGVIILSNPRLRIYFFLCSSCTHLIPNYFSTFFESRVGQVLS